MELSPLDEHEFVTSFNAVQNDAVATNLACGFIEADALVDAFEAELNGENPELATKYGRVFRDFRLARTGLKLALIQSEISEALEGVRKNLNDDHLPEFKMEEAELADAIIRIMNVAADRGLHVAEALVAKNRFNRTREDHTKTARSSEHGKRF